MVILFAPKLCDGAKNIKIDVCHENMAEKDRSIMINFEEELKNFKPSLEVEEAEQAIYNHELTDMTDVLKEMMQELKHNM